MIWIFKNWWSPFSRKTRVCPNLRKRVQNGPKIVFFYFLKNFVTSFSWKLSIMKTNFIIDISPPISYLAKFWFSSYGLKCCWPVKLQKFSNISRKKWMMKFFGAQINIEVFHKLIVPFWVCVTRYAQNTENKKFAYLCNIFRKSRGMKLIFCMQINTKVFHKLIVSLWLCIARDVQSSQNHKFAIFLQYLKENVKYGVDFSPKRDVKFT